MASRVIEIVVLQCYRLPKAWSPLETEIDGDQGPALQGRMVEMMKQEAGMTGHGLGQDD